MRIALFVYFFFCCACLREPLPDYVEVTAATTVVADWGVSLDGKVASITTIFPAGSPLYAEGIPDGYQSWRGRQHIYVQGNRPPANIAFGDIGPWNGGPALHVESFYDFSFNETSSDDLYKRGEIFVSTRSAWATNINNDPWMPEITFSTALPAQGTAVSIAMADGLSRPVSILPDDQEKALRHYACRAHAWAEPGVPWECFPFDEVWKRRDWFRCYRYTGTGIESAVDEEVHCPPGYYPYFAVDFDAASSAGEKLFRTPMLVRDDLSEE